MNQACFDELEEIRKRSGGILQAENVISCAENPKSNLHSWFIWDDGEAACKFRLWQARKLIRLVVITVPQTEEQIRAYVSLEDDRKLEGGGYRAMVDVLSDGDLRAKLLAQALKEMERWQEKYQQLNELEPIFAALFKVNGGVS